MLTVTLPAGAQVWTEERKRALVRLEIPEPNPDRQPSVGTGVLVRGLQGRTYVLTSTHVLTPGVTPPGSQPETCAPLPARAQMREGSSGGAVLEPKCVRHLGQDISLVELKPRQSPRYTILQITAPDIPEGQRLFLAGFPAAQDMSDTSRAGQVTSQIGVEPGLVVTDILTQGGMSGGPYLAEDGTVVGVHRGGLHLTSGFAQMAPISTVRQSLERFLPPIPATLPGPEHLPSPGGLFAGKIQIRDWSAAAKHSDRDPNPNEAEVLYEVAGLSPRTVLVDQPGGSFAIPCLTSADSKPGTAFAQRLLEPPYIGRPVEARCGGQVILGLTHPVRYAATELADAAREITALNRRLPGCLSRPELPVTHYLKCRVEQQSSIDTLMHDIKAIEEHFNQAIENGSDEQKPDARRRFGNFLTKMGRPCDAKIYLRKASTSTALQGLQPIKGWRDAVEACAQDPKYQTQTGAYTEGLADVKAAVEEEDSVWLTRAAPELFRLSQYLLARISEKQITEEEEVYTSWSVLT